MKILTYMMDKNRVKYATYRGLESIHNYSKHTIKYYGDDEIDNFDLDDFDIIHAHNILHKTHFNTSTKIIYNIHNQILTCPAGGLCPVLNKFLSKPLTCLDCLGYIGLNTGTESQRNFLKMAKRADAFVVHSDYMKEFYHVYSPTVLPLPLETDIFTHSNAPKEDYLLYTGRLTIQKNPFGFLKIINATGMKGKMAIYVDNGGRYDYYNEILNNTNPNIEVIINPKKEELAKLMQHAKFTVLPYLYQEPFGTAAADTVLCGTPLITFPYGNLRSFTNLLPTSLNEMIKLTQMNDSDYEQTLQQTLTRSKELHDLHEPYNAIKAWDELYEKTGA